MTEQQLLELSQYQTSDAFGNLARAALDLAVAMARTPTDIPGELTQRQRKDLDEAQLVELVATVAWENYQARFNRVFGVRSSGISDGAFCAMPEKHG